MNIECKKMTIENRMMNVVSYDSFCNNKELYNNTLTAVEKDGIVYPVRLQSDNRPGMYNAGCIDFFKDPNADQIEDYSADKILDMGNSKSIGELIEKQEIAKDQEMSILTSPDSIYVANISKLDSPVMKGLKEAINDKEIDINKYQDRFGRESFPNDKRKLKEHDITLFMLNRFTKALDMKATVTFEDKHPNVPNPMGTKITIDLTNYDDE